MNLTLQPAPEGIQAALAEQLALVVAHSELGAQRLDGKQLNAQGPIPIYVGDVTVTGAITRPRRMGWRFLIADDSTPLAIADLEQHERGKLVLSSVGYQTAAMHLQQALARLEHLPGMSKELRLLVVPRLHFHALWLFGRTSLYVVSGASGQDLGVPLNQKAMHAWLAQQHQVILGRRKLTN
ncbi:Uncharacterised protein [Burkholderia pseudomallei]|uniref:hypothetical protein n=1 Tax=Burkholderia pseudomallei TaxID=28450 RepID=UPI000AD397E5|nr:hypothetical protein [Burkholderia pseudomallei]NAX10195.1 hypothetical protein [Burkholderia pseudomallei]NAX98992.1 hypothetical protein [Burkholderia pseudomallei]NAY17625.1 hypothetical protein [Burkholderia pseudomallei]NAY24468.1 hypothetical protein [Burkholderia pseudomallei]NAY31399.1 hypothetical protein [Burkholderia pseudomallei]